MVKLLCYSLVLCLYVTSTYGQKTWKEVTLSTKEKGMLGETEVPNKAKVFLLNINAFKRQLSIAPQRETVKSISNVVISIPNAEGKLMRYRIEEASVFKPELQEKYPEIRSYAGYGIDDESAYLRFSISPYKGLSGVVLSGKKNESLIINPLTSDVNKCVVFRRSERRNRKDFFECSTEDFIGSLQKETEESNQIFAADDGVLRTFTLAMSVTGEYSAYHGGTLPLVNAAIAATLTRVNGIFENDFDVTMVLTATNDNVVYLDAGIDPYGPTDANYNAELQATLDTQIGPPNYDIGHLMSAIGNNGNAGCIGCVCIGGSKGSGYTTSTVPEGDNFDIDFVAHEMGHQFGGNHTFTFSSEGGIAQMEPGSGSTIMGYAGITGPTDLQPHSDPYFHAISIQQITDHAKSRTCDVETATGNATPVVDAGADITLPIGTAFKLIGSATDADAGQTLTYCWEQFDENNAANAYPDPSLADSNEPLFRSYSPTTSTERTFPLLADLVARGVNGNKWEKIPVVDRSADFRLTVRDNRPGGASNNFDDMIVTWNSTYGPFEVTSQNVVGLSYTKGETINVTWNVNNTTALAGSTNVNILLSTDGGVTFSPLLSDVPNDGSESVTLPNSAHQQCRILIEPTGNQYFAINAVDFAIGYDVVVTNMCQDYTINANINVPVNGASYTGYLMPDIPMHRITDLNVRVDITNADMAEMYYAISPPSYNSSNIFVRLASALCSGVADSDKIFDDEGAAMNCASSTDGANTIPEESLTAFDGELSEGDWIFWITDVSNPGNATWNSTVLTICYDEITSITLGTKDYTFDEFMLYPNPSKDSFVISLSSSSGENIEVGIHDIGGRRVYEKSFDNNESFNQEINVASLSTGIYFVTVTDGDRKEVRKIIVE